MSTRAERVRMIVLEEMSRADREQVVGGEAARFRVGNAAEVWRLTLMASDATVVAESLFMMPLTDRSIDAVRDRAFSLLACVGLRPSTRWRRTADSRIGGSITQ
ncbi:hypothetical protein [Microbacterium sp. NPDC089695]|uniref:hypothetical protein n=1 Tax=Microbacterium sp. NPDC089695 TaxID=3364198 RepID=UPI0037F5C751